MRVGGGGWGGEVRLGDRNVRLLEADVTWGYRDVSCRRQRHHMKGYRDVRGYRDVSYRRQRHHVKGYRGVRGYRDVT